MTLTQKRKILVKIQNLQNQIEQLEDVRIKLASNEFVSATMSSGSGSRSYTRADLTKVTEIISEMKNELRNQRKLLKGDNQALGNTIYIAYNIYR